MLLFLNKIARVKKHLLFLCTQLMVILVFAIIYWFIDKYETGRHFKGLRRGDPFMDFLYYSTATQTTVGYGDILPISWQTRALAMVQMIMVYVGLSLTEGDVLSYFN